MIETPDAPPGDIEAGVDRGRDESSLSWPQNPIGASTGNVAEDQADVEELPAEVEELPAEVPEEAVAEQIDDDAVGDDALGSEGAAAADDTRAAAESAAAADTRAVAEHEVLALQTTAAAGADDPAVLELRAQVAELTRTLAATQRRADELATVARKQTEMADELHADNRRLRDGEIREAVAPLVRGLARLADDLSRMRASATAASEDLAYLDGQVAELLHDAGVLTLRPAIGEPFDPRCHQATGSATTADSALNRTIAEVRRTGLRRDDGRMLRPVDVVVFRHVVPPPAQAQPATDEVT